MITFIIGGNKSGKTDHGLGLLEKAKGAKAMIVTARALDMGLRKRILRHRAGRDPMIPVIETHTDLLQVLPGVIVRYDVVLLDSLDLWLFNCMDKFKSGVLLNDFSKALQKAKSRNLIIISTETGLGPLPGDRFTLSYVRELGALNRVAADVAHEVVLMAAGQPLTIKRH